MNWGIRVMIKAFENIKFFLRDWIYLSNTNNFVSQQVGDACRLCSGSTVFLMTKLNLRRYKVSYFRCSSCGSIQTELPYWLDEAYAVPGVHMDVGSATRTVKNWMAASTLFDKIGLARDSLIVDFGAATGLFARLLRDVGYNARSYDKYSSAHLTNYFNAEHPEKSAPKIVTAFEVLEHFVNPKQEISALLVNKPDLLIFTTWFCDEQNEDWVYFVEDTGQHVFLYKQKALSNFVNQLGYDLVLTSFFHIFVRREAAASLIQDIEAFRKDSIDLVYAQARPIFESIAFGNDYIQKDFDYARQRLQQELDAANRSGHLRAQDNQK
jgi:Methyltransferase domain